MLRIEHSHDMFFAGMNHIQMYRTREDGSEYESDKVSTANVEAVMGFLNAIIKASITSGEEVEYNLTHLTDVE